MAFASILSGLSLITEDRRLYVTALSDTKRQNFHLDLEPHRGYRPGMWSGEGQKPGSRAQVRKLLSTLIQNGPIYLCTDTYMQLVLQLGILPQEYVAGVFAWPALTPCDIQPPSDPNTDRICRNVASYYRQLHNHHLRSWDGRVTAFPHRAANTRSYRAYAPYQNLERAKRGQIRPVNENNEILQFDWKAAEWTLLLHYCGYPVPDDAYAAWEDVADRDTVKQIVLEHIYGSSVEALYEHHGAEHASQIMRRMEKEYPEVLSTLAGLRDTELVDFEGFLIALGDEPYKRANRFVQTALQICKWDLLSRLERRGCGKLGCGDLHDQLIFDIGKEDLGLAQHVIEEVKTKPFGKYPLKPALTAGHTWN